MKTRWRRLLAAGAVACALPVVAVGGLHALVVERSHGRLFTVAAAPAGAVGVVLGAQVYPDGTPSPFLKARLDLAKQLYDTGKVRALVVSGDDRERSFHESQRMRDYLVGLGVPASRVVVDPAGYDTYDTCVRARRVFGVDRLTLITQSYHAPRAVATCRLVGVDAVAVGDESVRAYSSTWRWGAVREWPAALKMAWDVGTRRRPELGPPDDAVRRALDG